MLIYCFIVVAVFFAFILFINIWVSNSAKERIYYSASEFPDTKVVIVLGTSPYLISGNDNLYFKYRIDAAAELYFAGKVKKILVSGDNGTIAYNEPREMLRALIEKGIPEEDIILDYAGFRTFDSMIRAKEVFGQDTVIVVSQLFHLERALFISKTKGITAYGYPAADPQNSLKITVREYPARVSAFLDCYILHTKPKYLGKKIEI